MDASSMVTNKAVVGLVVMIAIRYTGYVIPKEVRIVYGVCMAVQALLLALMYKKISAAEEGATITVREEDPETKGVKSVPYTHRQYDTKLLKEQIQQFITGAAITVGMHMYGGYTTPMAIACLQPIFMAADPLFQIHVLSKEPGDKLQRPFPNPVTDMKIKMIEERDKRLALEAKAEEKTPSTLIEEIDEPVSSGVNKSATKRRAKRT